MATTQPADSDPPPFPPDGDLGDLWSWLLDQLGIGWGLLWGLIVPLLLVLAVGLALAVWLWRRSGRDPSSSTGTDIFPGHVVTVRSADGTHGQAFVEGSWWTLRGAQPLKPGQDVRVTAVDRLELIVEPLEPITEEES